MTTVERHHEAQSRGAEHAGAGAAGEGNTMDWLAASISIEEAMNDDGSGKTYVENEYLLALPINGALMYYVSELAYFELAYQSEPDFIQRYGKLYRDAPHIEWERQS